MKYCTHCGNPLEADSKFCISCGTPVENEIQPENSANNDNIPETEVLPPVNEVPGVPQQPANDFNTVAEEIPSDNGVPAYEANNSNNYQPEIDFQNSPVSTSYVAEDAGKSAKGGKLKKRIIAAFTVVCVLCASTVSAYFFIPSFKNWVIKTFASPSDYLGYVIEKNMGGANASAVFDAVKKASQSEGKVGAEAVGPILASNVADFVGSTYDMSMKVSVDNSIFSLLSALNLDEDFIDVADNFSSAEFAASMTVKETQFGLNTTGKINKKEIIKADISADFKEKIAFIDLNDLNETAYGVELDDEDVEAYLDAIKSADENSKENKANKKLITRYAKIILSDLNVKKGSEKLETDNLSKKYTTLSFTLKGSDLKKIAQDVLEEAKDDDQLLDLIIEENEKQGGQKITKSALKKSIEQELMMIKNMNANSFGNFKFVVVVYVDGDSMIKGMRIEDEEHDAELLYYADIEDKKEFETIVTIADELEIVGSGTVKNKKRTGEYEVNSAADGNILTITLKDWSTNPMEGRLSVRFSEDFTEEVLRDLPLYYRASRFEREAILMAVKNIEFFIDIEKAKEDDFAGGIGISFKGNDVIKLEVEASKKEAGKVKFPKEYTDDALDWIREIRSNFSDKLEEAMDN